MKGKCNYQVLPSQIAKEFFSVPTIHDTRLGVSYRLCFVGWCNEFHGFEERHIDKVCLSIGESLLGISGIGQIMLIFV
jgi:hypothetical protein